MTVEQLIEQLKKLPPHKFIVCQVVGQDTNAAWNMFFEFHEFPESDSMSILRVYHPDLKDLSINKWTDNMEKK